MKPSSLPSLPMDLPHMALPGTPTHTVAARKSSQSALTTATAPGSVQMVGVDVAHLIVDERFGMTPDALAERYAASVADAHLRLTTGIGQTVYPHVVKASDGRYAAVTELPTALAAIKCAADPASADMRLTVVLIDRIDGEALLNSVFTRARSRSLWEKARYIVGCETRYSSRREWLRAEGISQATWEPRFSKVAKISKLDGSLLALIDPHSISNAEVAGRIVDAWADPGKRLLIEDMTQTAAVAAGGIANAGSLFRRIDKALAAKKPEFVAGEWMNGTCDLHDPGGAVVATIRRDGAGWAITGSDLAALTRSALTAAHEALRN